jgi:hypothetical protein
MEGENDLGRYLQFLSPGEREEIIWALLPPNWIENQFSEALRAFFTWIDNEEPLPDLVLDVGPVKSKLLGGGITTFVDIVVDSWPSCRPEQVDTLQQAFFEGGELPEELCEPPEPMRSRVVDLASIGFEEQVRTLPEFISLIEPDSPVNEFLVLKEQLRSFRAVTLWGWMLPVSLLGVIMALAIRSWREFGSWWGIPLLLGGIGTLFLALLLSAGREALISSWVQGLGPGGFILDVLKTALNALYTAGLRPLWVQGFIIVILGLGLWLISRRGRRKLVATGPAEPVPPDPIETRVIEPSGDVEEEQDQGDPPSGIFG